MVLYKEIALKYLSIKSNHIIAFLYSCSNVAAISSIIVIDKHITFLAYNKSKPCPSKLCTYLYLDKLKIETSSKYSFNFFENTIYTMVKIIFVLYI